MTHRWAMSARLVSLAFQRPAARFCTHSLFCPTTSLNHRATMATDTQAVNGTPALQELRYIDIAINLTDEIFRGTYYGKKAHTDDLVHIIQRAKDVGVKKLMVTGSSVDESRNAIALAKEYPGYCYATIGVHPCSARSFEEHQQGPDALLEELRKLTIQARDDGTATAFGEFGLDYDRLQHCDKETQIKYFKKQLDIAVEVQLPLFLHSRAAAEDFESILKERLDKLPERGLVHSFTGTLEEMNRLVELGFDIGINGCSMKTDENIEIVKAVPLERLQLETDAPWCDMRASHASAKYLQDAPVLPRAVKKEKWSDSTMVKGRNEPCTMMHVAHAVARIKELPVEEVCEAAWRNSVRMFGLGETVS